MFSLWAPNNSGFDEGYRNGIPLLSSRGWWKMGDLDLCQNDPQNPPGNKKRWDDVSISIFSLVFHGWDM